MTSFTQLASGGDGLIYGIDEWDGHQGGRLLYFLDENRLGVNAPDGSTGWSETSGNQIGQGFDDIRLLATDGNAWPPNLYAVHQDGRLLFYQDQMANGRNSPNGSTGWAKSSGNQIGQHFEGIRLLAGGGDGIIYAVHQDGRLLFFQDEMRNGLNESNGSTGWSEGSGNQIGQGFEGIRLLAGRGDGALYAIHQDGRLLWYQDRKRNGLNAPDGSTGWTETSGNQIGQHFEGIKQIICGGQSGVIYAKHQDGRLLYYRDDNRLGMNAPDGSTGWAKISGRHIGNLAARDTE